MLQGLQNGPKSELERELDAMTRMELGASWEEERADTEPVTVMVTGGRGARQQLGQLG